MGESPGAHPAPWPTPLPAPLPGQPAWGGFSYNVVARFQHSPKQARAARHAVVTQKSPAKPHAGNNSTVVTVSKSESAGPNNVWKARASNIVICPPEATRGSGNKKYTFSANAVNEALSRPRLPANVSVAIAAKMPRCFAVGGGIGTQETHIASKKQDHVSMKCRHSCYVSTRTRDDIGERENTVHHTCQATTCPRE